MRHGVIAAVRRLLARDGSVPLRDLAIDPGWDHGEAIERFLTPGPGAKGLWRPIPTPIDMSDVIDRELSRGLDLPEVKRWHGQSGYLPARHHVARFRDASVFPASGVVMPAPGQVWTTTATAARWPDPKLEHLPGMRDGRFDARIARAAPRQAGPVMLVTTAFSGMYGHWLCDSLPGVHWLRGAIDCGAIALLASPLAPWQIEVIQAIAPKARIVETDAPIFACDDLVVPSQLGCGNIGHPAPDLEPLFAALRLPPDPAAPKLIYIARDKLIRNRHMTNDQQVIARLETLGFVTLRPETLPFAEQRRVFSNARVIVGAHGSGMANIGLAPPGALVVEIVPDHWVQAWIARLCAVLGHRYVLHPAPVEARSRGQTDQHGGRRFPDGLWFNANLDLLEWQARAAIERARP